ncbi:MAG: hypothetical protein Q4A21_00060 [bacterium]|nr:hypothetical protein [bacterium]
MSQIRNYHIKQSESGWGVYYNYGGKERRISGVLANTREALERFCNRFNEHIESYTESIHYEGTFLSWLITKEVISYGESYVKSFIAKWGHRNVKIS